MQIQLKPDPKKRARKLETSFPPTILAVVYMLEEMLFPIAGFVCLFWCMMLIPTKALKSFPQLPQWFSLPSPYSWSSLQSFPVASSSSPLACLLAKTHTHLSSAIHSTPAEVYGPRPDEQSAACEYIYGDYGN